MGMFDYIHYNGHSYQTKDTPAQLLDNYEIRAVGSLWHEDYDIEVVEDDNYFLKMYWNQINKRWTFCSDFTGEIRFYRHLDETYENWEEYSAYFLNGYLREIHLLENNNEL